VHLNIVKKPPSLTFSIEIESNKPYIDMKILHTIEKAFQRCEEIFLLNDFMPPPVMMT